MTPIIALVGRPNVGKSTLFNRLTQSYNALVTDYAGLTRDRIYGKVSTQDCSFTLIDTGGVTEQSGDLPDLVREQVQLALKEADVVFFVVDGRAGLTVNDEMIAVSLRNVGKPVMLVVNKGEDQPREVITTDFYSLGLGEPYLISALRGNGIANLLFSLQTARPDLTTIDYKLSEDSKQVIHLAVLGRPNVGKSTLVNGMTGEKRVIVSAESGTTRDGIYIPFVKEGIDYMLIDTAGLRRRSKVSETVEKLSVVKTLQTLDNANVVILVMDAHQGVSDQDIRLAGLILKSGRAVVIAVNKCDGMTKSQRQLVATDIERRLSFLRFADIHFISALHGRGIGLLFTSAKKAYDSAMAELSTTALTCALENAVTYHQPPLINGRRIKFRYAHSGGKNPPRIVIHGNQINATPHSYRRYLENVFRDTLKLQGTPIFIEFKQGNNPFERRKNKYSTPRSTKHQHTNRKKRVRHL